MSPTLFVATLATALVAVTTLQGTLTFVEARNAGKGSDKTGLDASPQCFNYKQEINLREIQGFYYISSLNSPLPNGWAVYGPQLCKWVKAVPDSGDTKKLTYFGGFFSPIPISPVQANTVTFYNGSLTYNDEDEVYILEETIGSDAPFQLNVTLCVVAGGDTFFVVVPIVTAAGECGSQSYVFSRVETIEKTQELKESKCYEKLGIRDEDVPQAITGCSTYGFN